MRLHFIAFATCAALALAGCGKGGDATDRTKAAGDHPGLTIRTDGVAPPPPTPKSTGGKLEVLPGGGAPETTEAAPAAPPVQSTAVPKAADPVGDMLAEQQDWADGPKVGAPTPRDCRRAARAGDPLAESPYCRDVLSPQVDPALVDDCVAADRSGDDFANSRACRGVLGR